MKTRNEIYQGEGAQLLRFITTYHSLQYEQVLRLFSKNRESKLSKIPKMKELRLSSIYWSAAIPFSIETNMEEMK